MEPIEIKIVKFNEKFGVLCRIDNQSFGLIDMGEQTKCEAKWLALMLQKAMKKTGSKVILQKKITNRW